MSNIYLKVTVKKNWRSQNWISKSYEFVSKVSFWRAPVHADITEFWNFLLQLKN